MLIQLNTDNHVETSNPVVRHAASDLEQSLERFSADITRVEVHFQDRNADKAGEDDKRCMLEARLKGRDPIAVSNTAATLTAAYNGARDKLVKTLDRQSARRRAPKGRDPFDQPEQSL